MQDTVRVRGVGGDYVGVSKVAGGGTLRGEGCLRHFISEVEDLSYSSEVEALGYSSEVEALGYSSEVEALGYSSEVEALGYS